MYISEFLNILGKNNNSPPIITTDIQHLINKNNFIKAQTWQMGYLVLL